MAFPFEFIQNVASQKMVTVGADGFIRQLTLNTRNMRQHWIRFPQRPPVDGTFKYVNRAFSGVVDVIGGQLVAHAVLQLYPDTGNLNQLGMSQPTLTQPV